MSPRSLFQWEPPEGTVIDQSFGEAYPQANGSDHRDVKFTARCERCGKTSETRASRADALEELDGHRCTRKRRTA